MSEPRPTVLTRLADLPVKGVPAEQYERERAEAKRRNREARGRMRKPGKLAVAETASAITWLPVPVPVSPGSRTFVHGVCSDAAVSVKERYL